VEGAPEPCLVLIVSVDVYILVLLETAEMVVLVAGADDAFFDLVGR
jgi:hypothetical protein